MRRGPRLRAARAAALGSKLNHLIDQDRIGEPELADRGDDLFQLSLGMRARVPRVRLEARGCPVSDRPRAGYAWPRLMSQSCASILHRPSKTLWLERVLRCSGLLPSALT